MASSKCVKDGDTLCRHAKIYSFFLFVTSRVTTAPRVQEGAEGAESVCMYVPRACCLNTCCRPKIDAWDPFMCFKRLKYPLCTQQLIDSFTPN